MSGIYDLLTILHSPLYNSSPTSGRVESAQAEAQAAHRTGGEESPFP